MEGVGRKGRRGLAVVAALLCAGLAGCCATVPLAERYFDRQAPFDTVNGFAYAVETGQYDFAYDSMTEGSQEKITRTKFKIGLMINYEAPEVKIPVRDLIAGARRERYRCHEDSYYE